MNNRELLATIEKAKVSESNPAMALLLHYAMEKIAAIDDAKAELTLVYTDLVWHQNGVSELDKHNVSASIEMMDSAAKKLGIILEELEQQQ